MAGHPPRRSPYIVAPSTTVELAAASGNAQRSPPRAARDRGLFPPRPVLAPKRGAGGPSPGREYDAQKGLAAKWVPFCSEADGRKLQIA
jgi:hypothetical protein